MDELDELSLLTIEPPPPIEGLPKPPPGPTAAATDPPRPAPPQAPKAAGELAPPPIEPEEDPLLEATVKAPSCSDPAPTERRLLPEAAQELDERTLRHSVDDAPTEESPAYIPGRSELEDGATIQRPSAAEAASRPIAAPSEALLSGERPPAKAPAPSRTTPAAESGELNPTHLAVGFGVGFLALLGLLLLWVLRQ